MRSEAKTTLWVFIGVLLTLAVILGREELPRRTLELTRNPHYLSTLADPALADRVQWIDERHLRFRCTYHADDHFPYQPCSLSFMLTAPGNGTKGADLTRFHSITLDLSYRGTSDFVRVAARTFDPRFSRPQDTNSARMQSFDLRASDIAAPVTIGLSEFTVPEWWVSMYKLPHDFNVARLDNVVSMTIDVPADVRGKEQDLEIRRITLQGDWIRRDTLYLAVLAAWMAAAIAFVARRIAYLRAAHDHLHRLVRVDPLTGVLNRRGGEELLAELAAQHRPLVLLIVDLDHFKRINDTHGHAAGDEVLRRTASVIAHSVRAADAVVRWGGEEFLVVCVDCAIEHGAGIAQKMRQKLEASSFGRRPRIAVTASIGVAAVHPGDAFADAFGRADAALYRAKGGGRNRVAVDGEPDIKLPHAAEA